LSLNKVIIFFNLFLFSCTSNQIQAEQIKPEQVFCGNTMGQFLKFDKNYLTSKSKKFEEVLSNINLNSINKGYNLIVTSGQKPTGGFSLKFKNIKKKKEIFYVNFVDMKPPKNSKVTFAITYPYCILKIENLDKLKISIK